MTFDIGKAGMRRDISSHLTDLQPEMILEGFSKGEDKKTMTPKH